MFRSFIKGFLVGSAVGGVLTLLYTPHSGKENRENIKKYADNLAESTTDMAESLADAQTSLSDLSNQVSTTYAQTKDDIQRIIRDFKQSTLPQLNQLQKQTAQLQQDAEEIKIRINEQKESG